MYMQCLCAAKEDGSWNSSFYLGEGQSPQVQEGHWLGTVIQLDRACLPSMYKARPMLDPLHHNKGRHGAAFQTQRTEKFTF